MNLHSSFRQRLSAAGALLMAFILPAVADPAWWSASETKIWDASPQNNQNWSPINAGQLKNVATKAKRFMDVTLIVGAGPSVDAICQFPNLDNYAPVNVGQLKNIAKPFYDRLAQIGFNWQTGAAGVPSSPYPWDQTISPDNGMPANLGQLKNVFSFDLGDAFVKSDADADGMPSWWETLYGLNSASSADAAVDSDGDGQTNLREWQLGTNPAVKETFVSYGTSYTDLVALQPDSPMTFQKVGTADYVSYGILACDQTLRYGRDNPSGTDTLTVRLKGGKAAKFYYPGSTAGSPGYLSSGTLSDRAVAQALAYGLHNSGGYATKLFFKPGTAINFRHNPFNSIASGYVLSGVIEGAQDIYCGQSGSVDTKITAAAGTACDFIHFSTNGAAMSGYLQSGVVGVDKVIPYSYVETGNVPSVKIKAGTAVSFQHYKSNGSAANGYLKKGTLAENAQLKYSSASLISAASGTAVEFDFMPLSTNLAAYGYVSRCVPAVNSVIRYGSQTSPDATVTIMAGKHAALTRVGSGATNVGYLKSGTLATPGPVPLPYSFSPVYYANFAVAQEISFIRRTDNNQGCVSTGFLEDAGGSQLIYPRSDSTTSQSVTNGSLLGVSITSTGSPPITKAYVRTSVPLDDDNDGFTNAEEAQMGTNPLVPDNFQRNGDLSNQLVDIRAKTLVVVGDGEAGKVVSKSQDVTIDAGSGTWLVVLAIKSEEFPEWTRNSSVYDDTVKATVTGAFNVTEPLIHVNALHQEWLNACKFGSEPASFLGYGPIYTKILGSVQAVPAIGKSISFKLDVVNVSDGLLATTAILSLIPVEVAVDANRNGEIEFGTDATTPDKPYEFWVNHDRDIGHTVDGDDWEEDDVQSEIWDISEPGLKWRRDLEDFTRVWLDMRGLRLILNLDDANIKLFARMEPSDGEFLVTLYQAVEADGGRKYLTDSSTGYNQTQIYYGEELCTPDNTTQGKEVPRRAWESLPPDKVAHLLFEGRSVGKGKLIFEFRKNGQILVALPPVFLNLKNVQDMYETWTVGDVLDQGEHYNIWPAASATKTTGQNLPIPKTSQEKDYFLFVHGWNMSPFDKDAFAATAFKRLWHQGYKGRFGAFRWPTFWFAGEIPNTDNFDGSEQRAWNSGGPLAGLVAQLSSTFQESGQSKVRLYAHSMGNIVASECLRQMIQAPKVHTYISAQAALSSHVWDNTTPLMPFTVGGGLVRGRA